MPEDEEMMKLLEASSPINYPSLLLRGLGYCVLERKNNPHTQFISAVRGLRMVLRRDLRERVDEWMETEFRKKLDDYRKQFGDEQKAVLYAYEDLVSKIVDEIDKAGLLMYRPRRMVGGIW